MSFTIRPCIGSGSVIDPKYYLVHTDSTLGRREISFFASDDDAAFGAALKYREVCDLFGIEITLIKVVKKFGILNRRSETIYVW